MATQRTAVSTTPPLPADWRLDELTRQRARSGIALAREALRASAERRAAREASDRDDRAGLDLVA